MLEYNIQNTLKAKEVIPGNVQHIIDIFREKVINVFDYKVERVITYKCFVENNGKFIPIFDNSRVDKELGIFHLNNKFFKDPFYQEYLLERESLFVAEFENTLSWIENRYNVLKSLKDQDGIAMFSTIKAFRKAVSGGLNTGRNFGSFQVGYKFLKQHFSFIHGTFRERNFDLFHGEKKKFVRMELLKKINTHISLDVIFDDTLSVYLKYSNDLYGTDLLKKEKITFNNIKEKNLFITLFNKFNSYTNGLNYNKNPYITNAIYSMGISKLSKRKISLAYSLINDLPIDLNNDISLLKLKNKEYLTDTAYKFRQELGLSGKIHPISLVTNHDYVDFSVENLDLFMNKILSYNCNSFINQNQHSYFDKTKKLFTFIDLYGEEFTKDILLRDFNLSDHTKNYEYIKKADKLNLIKYLRFSPHNNSIFIVSNSSLSQAETLLWETNLSNNFNALMQENFLDNTDFKYYEQPIFKKKKQIFFSEKEEAFFDSINHIFFFSLLSMTGVKIQELSFDDCINTELKSNLREYNKVFENFVLDSTTDDCLNTFPIISRKKHLEILSFVKKINLFLLSSEWEVELTNFNRLRSFFDVTSLYKYLSNPNSEINLKELHKLFLKKLRTNPDVNELISFFDRHNIHIDPEIRF